MFFSRRGARKPGRNADVAQLVERNLAKVEVAGSNPVVRSERVRQARLSHWWSGREARQRTANPCTRVRIPSPPQHPCTAWTIGAAVARFPDTEEVTGSIPVSSTKAMAARVCGERRTGRFRYLCAFASLGAWRGLRHPHPLGGGRVRRSAFPVAEVAGRHPPPQPSRTANRGGWGLSVGCSPPADSVRRTAVAGFACRRSPANQFRTANRSGWACLTALPRQPVRYCEPQRLGLLVGSPQRTVADCELVWLG
jgi:hypothetical protein